MPRLHSAPPVARPPARPLTRALLLALALGCAGASAPALDASPAPGPGGTPVATVVRADVATVMLPPVPGADPQDVLRAFAAPLAPWGRGHRGVDLADPSGRVLAPAAGTVRFAGPVVGRGVLTVEHPDGTLSSFEPVTTTLLPGTPVRAGQEIARVDPLTPHCAVTCVHWGVRRPSGWRVGGALFDRYLDPLLLIGWSGPSVLWPQGDDGAVP